jgi:hypothetical protein
VFSRKAKAAPVAVETTATSGKGRPTPTRKEAEAARKSSISVPKDPKAARAAARERTRQNRIASRAGSLLGSPETSAARDAGPVRAHVRDFVDSRWTTGEVFVPIAFLVLIGSVALPPTAKSLTYLFWLGTLFLMILDGAWLSIRVRRSVAKEFPDAATRGLTSYAVMRGLQMRRLRLPKPRVKAGGKPVIPKVRSTKS